ncbi:DUF1040 family protein [Echinimonas agarilytica]|uniref:YihD family protein n=1 Tax=Echinimonas agarilytica TaxID=1215918 RepID=A0AA41W3M2_9GAMM|nr:DUF1040 family protein [Echinimonas agarilytica]MCM2678184.1 YihD family protein [Echinimonas agarilytica]
MNQHKIEEITDLLRQHWLKHQDLQLTELLQQLATQSGSDLPLHQVTDDTLFYQLKMGGSEQHEMLPGIAKDCEDDFKTALLKARGIID